MHSIQDISRRSLLHTLSASALAASGVACAQTLAAPANKGGPRLRLIGHTALSHKLQFQGTTVGGLSGLDYDKQRGVYYAISDDRSDINPARFYTLKLPITADSVGAPELLKVTTLQAPNGKPYPNRRSVTPESPEVPDPESIRLRAAPRPCAFCARDAPGRQLRQPGARASDVCV
jgi:hypothetical protein